VLENKLLLILKDLLDDLFMFGTELLMIGLISHLELFVTGHTIT
jgi:hypothetical protein